MPKNEQNVSLGKVLNEKSQNNAKALERVNALSKAINEIKSTIDALHDTDNDVSTLKKHIDTIDDLINFTPKSDIDSEIVSALTEKKEEAKTIRDVMIARISEANKLASMHEKATALANSVLDRLTNDIAEGTRTIRGVNNDVSNLNEQIQRMKKSVEHSPVFGFDEYVPETDAYNEILSQIEEKKNELTQIITQMESRVAQIKAENEAKEKTAQIIDYVSNIKAGLRSKMMGSLIVKSVKDDILKIEKLQRLDNNSSTETINKNAPVLTELEAIIKDVETISEEIRDGLNIHGDACISLQSSEQEFEKQVECLHEKYNALINQATRKWSVLQTEREKRAMILDEKFYPALGDFTEQIIRVTNRHTNTKSTTEKQELESTKEEAEKCHGAIKRAANLYELGIIDLSQLRDKIIEITKPENTAELRKPRGDWSFTKVLNSIVSSINSLLRMTYSTKQFGLFKTRTSEKMDAVTKSLDEDNPSPDPGKRR